MLSWKENTGKPQVLIITLRVECDQQLLDIEANAALQKEIFEHFHGEAVRVQVFKVLLVKQDLRKTTDLLGMVEDFNEFPDYARVVVQQLEVWCVAGDHFGDFWLQFYCYLFLVCLVACDGALEDGPELIEEII